MIQDTLKTEIKNDIKNTLSKHGLMRGDKYAAEILQEFAKIVRGNLTGISRAVQELFEAKYLQLTGSKMYGGFKD